MDALVAPLSWRRQFRRRPWGYARRDVDRYVDEVVTANTAIRNEIERLRADADPVNRLGRDIASVLQALTDAVAEARQHAEADAEKLRSEAVAILTEAEADANTMREEAATEADRQVSAVLGEATTRFAAIREHRDTASAAMSRALDALQTAMTALAEVPVEVERPRSGEDEHPPAGPWAPLRTDLPNARPVGLEQFPGHAWPRPPGPHSR